MATTEELISAIGEMQILDLSHTIEEGMPVFPTHPQYFHMEWNTGDPANLYQLLISEHAGTHLDCPSHFYGDSSDPRRICLEEVPVSRFINRGIKLVFRNLSGEIELQAEDIREWERSNTRINENDAVIFSFGWDQKWQKLSQGHEYLSSWPGISRGAAAYLVEREVSLVGTDCLGIDGSSTPDLGSHFTLLEKGILIVENLKNLEKLPNTFLLITLPLKIKDGTGCPVRAVAVYKE